MHPTLQTLFDQLEQQRHELLRNLAHLSPEKYRLQPGPGKWSLAQILTHLMVAEQLSLAYMQKKSLGIATAGTTGWQEEIKMFVLVISQRMPLRYNAPSVVLENTPESLSYQELQVRWDDLRAGLQNFLEKISPADLTKKIYKHPVAGRMNVQHALRFFAEHIRHHWPQVKRLL